MLFKKRTSNSKLLGVLFKYLIQPTSSNPDTARKEFILNILLIGLIILSIPAVINNFIKFVFVIGYHGANPLITGTILFVFCFLLLLSRLGKSRISSLIFILLLLAINLSITYRWGPDLGEALLIYSLVIVMTGILIDSKAAFFVSLISGGVILLLSYLKIQGIYHSDDRWRFEMLHFADTVIQAITLGIIALVSWLFNREMERALRRAWRSEAAVEKQRDKLEVTVEKRTKELKLAQAEKLAQLYRFAQFGRMASGLFHDLVNPLNLVSLNLDILSRRSKRVGQQKLSDIKVLLNRAVDGIRRLENFVQAARRQVQHQEAPQTFSLANEITQVIQMLEHKAKKSHVKISLKLSKDIKMFGNSMKFSQLITNLVLNAIDAYENVKRKEKLVEVRLQKINSNVRLEVQDWGSGIHEKYLPRIFDPLFTTKIHGKGIGMGLSICKDVIEKDLKGKCVVKSKIGIGTTFVVEFSVKKNVRLVR